MKRSGEIKRKTPMKRTGFKQGNSLKGRSPKKDGDDYQFNSTFKRKPPVPAKPGSSLKSGGGLKQKAPMKAKRDTPRRKMPERIEQERIAPKAGEKPTPNEKKHMERVAKMPCLVCGKASTLHHVTGYADKIGRMTRSHKCIVPLCPQHHQKVFDPKDSDPISVEGLGHQRFFEKHGKDLLAIGNKLWLESVEKLNLKESDQK